MSPRPFQIGEWRVEPSLNQLTRGSFSQRITPKAMEVLVLLVGRTGQAVAREEILEHIWKDVHVQEEVLTRAISDLRKALEDDRKTPQYIETIPKRGYRVIADVSPIPPPVGPVGPVSPLRKHLSIWSAAAVLLAILAVVLIGIRAAHRPTPLILETRPLTTFPGREIQPALSPDGTRVAFAWEGASGNDWDIHVKGIGDDTLLKLTEDPGIDLAPTWSPDGKRIAFARYSEMGECRILEVSSLGGSEREVGSCGKSQNPDLAWSPDGKWLAFSDRESDSESFGIYLLSLETGERRKLVSPGGQHWGDKDPAFSPDGDWVAFTRSVSMDTQDVYRVPVGGGEPERVTFDGRELRGLAYASGGRELIVSSARNGALSLWRVPLGGFIQCRGAPPPRLSLRDSLRSLCARVEDSPERLVSSGGTARAPSVGAKGDLVFEERWRDGDIVSLRLGGASAEPLIVSTHEDREPAISPDGTRVAFVSSRSGSLEIWMSDAEGRGAKRLTDFEGPSVGVPCWSPDGRLIAFDARPAGNADLFFVSTGDDAPKPFMTSPDNEIGPSFDPGGRYLYFGSDRGGKWQIWKAPLGAEGKPETVTREGGYFGRVSADGGFLFFTKFDSPGLHRLELSSGIEERVAGTESLGDACAWSFDGDTILFVGFEAGASHLFRLEATGTVTKLGTIEFDPGGGLVFDAPRHRILFTRLVRSESDLVLAALPAP